MLRSCSHLAESARLAAIALLALLIAAPSVRAQAPAPAAPDAAAEPAAAPDTAAEPAPPPGVNLPAKDAMEENFAAYLHFALVGQFEVADRYAQAFLALPEFAQSPMPAEAAQRLVALSDEYKNSIDTLLLIIANTPISENAQKVLSLIREAHRLGRMAPERITDNIKLLAGTPVQQAVALERLRESGEYAIPWLLEALADARQSNLHPFIVRTLPLLGKRAVNPLVQALSIENPVVRGAVADALGRIGYPQALPYLQRVVEDRSANAAVKEAAAAAIRAIVVSDPAVKELPAAELFRLLAEQYYENTESLRPDPTEPRANVWSLRDGILTPTEVPPEIYRWVMAMRAARASLELQPNQPRVVALWLAANFNREHALGLDVASEEPAQTADLTKPADYPRSIYFARTFGPMYSQLALARAIRDNDPAVALGSIAALDVTAGPATMVDPKAPEAASLADALNFPDLLVRIRAALALARSLPQANFTGSDQVVPILASAVSLTGKRNYLLVESDETLRTRLQSELGQNGNTVIAAGSYDTAIDRAHRELTHLDGAFLSTDLDRPSLVEAVRELRRDRRFALTPIVLIVKPDDNLIADRAAADDRRIGRVFVVGDAEPTQLDLGQQLVARRDEVAPRFGHRELSPELSLSLALEAARVLRTIALNRSPVLDIQAAESSLILALAQPSEELRIAAADALALRNAPPAQRALATVALSAEQTPTLRRAAYGALAESGRRFGNLLDKGLTDRLIRSAVSEPDLALRTAASQAMGAMNLPGEPVARIIIAQP